MTSESRSPTSMEAETENSATINDLLSADPETITDEDAYKIVAHLRERREQWERADGEVKRKGKGRTKRKDGAGQKTTGTLKLEDLQIDLDAL